MSLNESYLTISEAAEQIGVTRQTISRWIKSGKLKYQKVGRIKLIPKNELLNVQKSENAVKTWDKKIVGGAIKLIRFKLGYSDEDKIEITYILGQFKGYFKFIVTKKKGGVDIVKFYPYFKRRGDEVLYWASKIERETYKKTGQYSLKTIDDIENYIENGEKKQRGVA